MSGNLLPTLRAVTHPLTGRPIQAVGFRRDGRPIWPIMGGDPSNDPQRPEDVPEETWDALGDPGKRALVSERTARLDAEKARDTAIRERDAARARPTPPPGTPAAPPTPAPAPANPGNPGNPGQPDIAALIQQGIEAAMKPFQDAETQRTAERAAGKVREAVLEAAKPLLHDPTDALANVDLASVVNEAGMADAEKLKTALQNVIATKPHLAKTAVRTAPPGIGGGGQVATVDADKVKAVLADMQAAAGIRPTQN